LPATISGGAQFFWGEDEPFVREATSSILEHAGFEVLPAMDAQSAIRIYQQHAHGIDLVVTDMFLPGQGGEQLGHELREQSPEIAVLITSGYAKSESEIEACEARTYFPAKPIRGVRFWRKWTRFWQPRPWPTLRPRRGNNQRGLVPEFSHPGETAVCGTGVRIDPPQPHFWLPRQNCIGRDYFLDKPQFPL
jgi:CheY-like chemotaxis protein